MPREAIRPSVAVARLLREARERHGFSLADVAQRTARLGDSIPPSTLARIERGQADPGVRRLHQLLRLYNVPPQLAAELVEIERLAAAEPADGNLETLYREGLRSWQQGDVSKGLAHLFAVRRFVADAPQDRVLRQKAVLSFAIAARELGKHRLARQVVDDLLCEPPHPSLLVNALGTAASLWLGLGATEVALALLRQAETHLATDDQLRRAWLLHQTAKALLVAGRLAEARLQLDEALALYRGLGDTDNEARARLLQLKVLEAEGQPEQALAESLAVREFAAAHGHPWPIMDARLQEGRLLLKARSATASIGALREALGRAVLLGDQRAQFLAHYHLALAYELAGDPEHARLESTAARYYVQFVDDVAPEAEVVRTWIKRESAHARARKRHRPRRR